MKTMCVVVILLECLNSLYMYCIYKINITVAFWRKNCRETNNSTKLNEIIAYRTLIYYAFSNMTIKAQCKSNFKILETYREVSVCRSMRVYD
jgi:hypothetical protein